MIRTSKIFCKHIEKLGADYTEFSKVNFPIPPEQYSNHYNIFIYTMDHISTPTGGTGNSTQGENYFIIHVITVFFILA